ncbi:hypothetical protein TURU_164686 [Turdus rufiventris]|nr:hypothetical protein TURU_164686 [Turdus rufiventris]
MDHWAETSGRRFNKDKCQVLHMVTTTPDSSTDWGKNGWNAAQQKRILAYWLAAAEHEPECAQMMKMAKGILGCISNSVASRSREGIVPLFSTLLMLHLEFCAQYRGPHYETDTEVLERVQRRAAELGKSLEHNTCQECLRELGMFSLETKEAQGRPYCTRQLPERWY